MKKNKAAGDPGQRAPFSAFLDRGREPTRAAVGSVLGPAREAWDDLEKHLLQTYRLGAAFHFMYGERYGWALRLHRGGRLFAALYPSEGKVTVQVILNRAQVAAAPTLGLSPRIITVLSAAKDYPEGRWLFVPVDSVAAAHELRPLLALKASRVEPPAGAATRRKGGVAAS